MLKLNKLTASILAVTASGAFAESTLAQDDNALEEVVVTATYRSSLIKAAEQKRNAASIQDGIVAEDLGKFPDQNVAESLQRIPGVSISRANGEGSKVTVRGFGPAFNTVRVNGRTLATTEKSREFDFAVLPSDLISGANVIKSPTANIEAGSIGAYVNVSTAKPLDKAGFQASSTLNLAYGDLAGDTNPEYSGLISNTFADDTIGVLLAVSHKDTSNRIDSYSTNLWHERYALPVNLEGDIKDSDGNVIDSEGFVRPGRAKFGVQEEERTRTGVYGVVQWAPNENWTTTVDVFRSELDRQTISYGFQVPLQSEGGNVHSDVVVDGNNTLESATISDWNIDMQYGDLSQDSVTEAYGFNTVFSEGALTLTFDAAVSKAKASPKNLDVVPHFTLPGDLDNRSYSVDFSQGDVLSLTSTIDVADPDSIRSHWNGPGRFDIEDEVSEYKFDAIYDIDKGVLASVEAGASYSRREKAVDDYSAYWVRGEGDNDYYCMCGGAETSIYPNSDQVFAVKTFDNFLNGEAGNYPNSWVVVKDIDAYIASQQQMAEEAGLLEPGESWYHEYYNPGGSYSNTEATSSLFGQANFDGELGDRSWTANAGLRYLQTKNTAKGYGVELVNITLRDPDINQMSQNLLVVNSDPKDKQVDTDYDYWLPSANFSLNFADGWYARAAAAKTITQPAISDKGVNQWFGVSTSGVSVGGSNPYLKPYEVNQYDLSLEYYADNGDAYSAALFRKDITSFISVESSTEPYTGPLDDLVKAASDYPSDGLTQVFVGNKNKPGGSVSGLELSALHHFDYLPGFLSGFGVQANFTYATSKSKEEPAAQLPSITNPDSSLEGFAKRSYNITTFYENGPFQARLGYNWRDRFLLARDGAAYGAAGMPVHTEEYGQLDASVSYDITDGLTLTAEVINLTNERRLQFIDVRDRVQLLEYTGQRFRLGIRATF